MRVGLDIPSGTIPEVFKGILETLYEMLYLYPDASQMSLWEDWCGNIQPFLPCGPIDDDRLKPMGTIYLHLDGFWRNHPEELK